MKAKLLGIKGSWREVADSARTTIHKEEGVKEQVQFGNEEYCFLSILQSGRSLSGLNGMI